RESSLLEVVLVRLATSLLTIDMSGPLALAPIGLQRHQGVLSRERAPIRRSSFHRRSRRGCHRIFGGLNLFRRFIHSVSVGVASEGGAGQPDCRQATVRG